MNRLVSSHSERLVAKYFSVGGSEEQRSMGRHAFSNSRNLQSKCDGREEYSGERRFPSTSLTQICVAAADALPVECSDDEPDDSCVGESYYDNYDEPGDSPTIEQ